MCGTQNFFADVGYYTWAIWSLCQWIVFGIVVTGCHGTFASFFSITPIHGDGPSFSIGISRACAKYNNAQDWVCSGSVNGRWNISEQVAMLRGVDNTYPTLWPDQWLSPPPQDVYRMLWVIGFSAIVSTAVAIFMKPGWRRTNKFNFGMIFSDQRFLKVMGPFFFFAAYISLMLYLTELIWWGKIGKDYNAAMTFANNSLVFNATRGSNIQLPQRQASGFGGGNVGWLIWTIGSFVSFTALVITERFFSAKPLTEDTAERFLVDRANQENTDWFQRHIS